MKTKDRYLTIILMLVLLNLISCGRSDMWENLHKSGLLPGSAITYDGNGSESGDVPVDATRYSSGDEVTVLANTGSLARSGYKFNGWALTAGSTVTDYTAGQTFTMGSSDITLYARWIADSVITYTVTYDANGATGTVPVDTTAYTNGQTVYLPAQGTLASGSNPFCGWNTNQSSPLLSDNHQPGETITIDSNITFYALWEPPIMVGESFNDITVISSTDTTGMFIPNEDLSVSGGIVYIPDGAVLMSREFRIPAIIEGTATIYPADYESIQQQNRFMAVRDEVYDSENLPAVFSFDIVNNTSSREILTIVTVYNSDGGGASAMVYTGFSFIDDTFNYASILPHQFRIVLYNNYQNFYIYDADTSSWTLVRHEEYSLTSDVWWHFFMAGVNNTSDGTAYPHQLDSLTIRTIESGDLP